VTDFDAIPDADPTDELASALLDGAATAEELARAAEPEVAARVAAFRALAARVAEPVAAPDPARRDAAIAAAVAAARRPEAEVVSLRARRVPRWLVPVAAAAAVVVGIGALAAGLGGGDDDADVAATAVTEGSADEAAPTPGAAAGSSEGGAAESAPAPAATAMAALPDLGELAAADLPAALRALVPREDAAGEGGDGGPMARDAGVPCAERFGPTLVAVVTARVDGVAVTVGLFGDEGTARYVALDQADCGRKVAAGEL